MGDVSATSAVQQPDFWDEWTRITRFLQSARLAFARERSLWKSLELEDGDNTLISAPAGGGRYKVALATHLEVMSDDEMLCASVLLHSYALAEVVALDHLNLTGRGITQIEDWGARLLQPRGLSWTNIAFKGDGKAKLVEVAVVRNAHAHGSRILDSRGATRLADAGATGWSAGAPLPLTFALTDTYRVRLKLLLRLGGLDRPRDERVRRATARGL